MSLPGIGTTTYNNNTWGFSETPEQQAWRNQIEASRSAILKGLGITTPQREASRQQWADAFTKEALRTSMPQLEQTLFGRGLGGSRFYNDAVTDLLSKVATQATLNKEGLAQQDEQLKLQQLGSVAGLDQQGVQNLMNLLGMASTATQNKEQLAQNMYLNTLPYTAKQKVSGGSALDTILPIAAIAANFIPGIGQALSLGLGAANAARTAFSPKQSSDMFSQLALQSAMGQIKPASAGKALTPKFSPFNS